MVSNVQVLDNATGEYAPIDETSSYWVVTNKWIAEKNGDNYLHDVTPLNVISTDLGYTQELENFLTTMDGPWDPPTIPDEMSTVSFNAVVTNNKTRLDNGACGTCEQFYMSCAKSCT